MVRVGHSNSGAVASSGSCPLERLQRGLLLLELLLQLLALARDGVAGAGAAAAVAALGQLVVEALDLQPAAEGDGGLPGVCDFDAAGPAGGDGVSRGQLLLGHATR